MCGSCVAVGRSFWQLSHCCDVGGPALPGRGVGEDREEAAAAGGGGGEGGGGGSSAEHLIFAGSRGHVEAVLCGGPYILVPGTPSWRGGGSGVGALRRRGGGGDNTGGGVSQSPGRT